ncbi:MAG: hemerythrin domain-containing protein, partial [Fidelibacterota bacterium]
HHGKEEELLFERIAERGIPRTGGPIGVMLGEHDMGRGYVSGMTRALEDYRAGEKGSIKGVLENFRKYTSLLRDHIYKEDNILYPLADDVLTDEDQKELLEKFEIVERERIGEEKHHQFIHFVEEMERKYR